jgi:hypothetical protein
MTLTAHDDAVGEVVLNGLDRFGASGSIGQAPNSLSLSGRSLHYILPTSQAGVSTFHNVGWNCSAFGTPTTSAPVANDLRQASQRSQMNSIVANTAIGVEQDSAFFFRGNLPKVGGFFLSWRLAFPQMQADTIVFVGACATARVGGTEPSAVANAVAFAADSGDANLALLSVDGAGAFTKSAAIMPKANLATGDPNTTFARVLEFQLWCQPNAASVQARLYDWSNEAWVLGPTPTDVTLTLPSATTALRMSCKGSTKSVGIMSTQAFIHAYGYY